MNNPIQSADLVLDGTSTALKDSSKIVVSDELWWITLQLSGQETELLAEE
jgi:hypothetical protein